MSTDTKNAFEVPGKLEIPFRYFAGACGSRFLTALRDDQIILGTKCPKTGTVFVPPRSVSDRCFKRTDDWIEVGPRGVVTSFTIVRSWAPHYPMKPPFAIALIKLDWADTDLCHLLGEVELDKIEIGMRVEPVWAKERKGRITDIKFFRPVRAAAKPAESAEPAPRKKAGRPKKAAAIAAPPAPPAKLEKPARKKAAKKRAAKKAVAKKAVAKKPAARRGPRPKAAPPQPAKKAAKAAVKRSTKKAALKKRAVKRTKASRKKK